MCVVHTVNVCYGKLTGRGHTFSEASQDSEGLDSLPRAQPSCMVLNGGGRVALLLSNRWLWTAGLWPIPRGDAMTIEVRHCSVCRRMARSHSLPESTD